MYCGGWIVAFRRANWATSLIGGPGVNVSRPSILNFFQWIVPAAIGSLHCRASPITLTQYKVKLLKRRATAASRLRYLFPRRSHRRQREQWIELLYTSTVL